MKKIMILLLAFLCAKLNGQITVSTYAGSSTNTSGSTDGPRTTAALFNGPNGVSIDLDGNVYVADCGNHKIRKVGSTLVTTIGGNGNTSGYVNGNISQSKFNLPLSCAVDYSGNTFVADYANHVIRKIDPNGNATTYAGSSQGWLDAPASVAQFNSPTGVAINKVTGDVYVADYGNGCVRRIYNSGSNIVVTTLNGTFIRPYGVAVDLLGNVYITDVGDHTVKRITPTGGFMVIAGSGAGFINGQGTNAKFSTPAGLAVTPTGIIYVADFNNHRIRMISPTFAVTTLAGSGSYGYDNGSAGTATFNGPAGVVLDEVGDLYVADYYNNKIRKIAGIPLEINDMSGNYNPVQYSRFEMGLCLAAGIQKKINDFLADSTTVPGSYDLSKKINPYDPDQIKIVCQYTHITSQTSYNRFGFFYKDFNVSNNKWNEQVTDYKFRIRFAPPKTGNYIASVYLYLNNVSIKAGTFTFTASAAPTGYDKGHLKMAGNDPYNNLPLRKLQYDNGDMFFGISQNMGLILDPADKNQNNVPGVICNEPGICYTPVTYTQHRSFLSNLGANKGNFTRVGNLGTCYAVEYPFHNFLKNDPLGHPTNSVGHYLNNYDENQRYMWELDNAFSTLELNNMKTLFCTMNDQVFCIKGMYDDGSFGWNKNMYSSLPNLGWNSDSAICFNNYKRFFTDATAKSFYKKYLYYVIARWGYSTSLAAWQMVNETFNLGAGNKVGVNITKNNPADTLFRWEVSNWLKEMKLYMQYGGTNGTQFYPGHPFSVGGGLFGNFKDMDFDSDNSYTYDVSDTTSNNCDYLCKYCGKKGKYVSADFCYRFSVPYAISTTTDRPFIWGEMGMGDAISDLVDVRDDRHFHNAVWASLMTSGIGTGLYLYDWGQTGNVNHRANFNSIKAFVNRIDFSRKLLPYAVTNVDNWVGVPTQADVDNIDKTGRVNVHLMRTADTKTVYGWVHNHSSNWTTDFFTKYSQAERTNLKSITNLDTTDIWKYNIPASYNVEIPVKDSLATYQVKIYNTYEFNGDEVASFNVTSNANKKLKFGRYMPNSTEWTQGDGPAYRFDPDYAFIAKYISGGQEARPGKQRDSTTTPLTINTVSEKDPNIKIYPNPAHDNIKVYIPAAELGGEKCKFEIYDATGKLVRAFESSNEETTIDLHNLSSGLYSVSVKNSTFSVKRNFVKE